MKLDQLLRSISIEKEEFFFQFQSHPNYPSALAFSDTLNFLGIKNEAYELEKEYWKELPEKFISIYKNNFALIKKEQNYFKIFSNDIETISKEELIQNSTNFVLLFEKEQDKNTETKINFNYFVNILLIILLVFTVLTKNWFHTAYNVLSLIGIYISLEIFNNKFGKESIVLNNICGRITLNNQSSCTKIIDSDKINIFGLKLSDFSLIYFIGIASLGLFFSYTEEILKIISIISVPIILYSLFIQVFIEKKFCKICLLLITVLILQIVISQNYFLFHSTLNTIIISLIAFVFLFFSIVFLNKILIEKHALKISNIKNIRFKRNFDLFKKELFHNNKVFFENDKNGFFIGLPNSKLHISLISNPFCGFCKEAHYILEELLKKYPNDISAQVRFNHSSKSDEKQKFLLSNLLSIYIDNGSDAFIYALHQWFDKKEDSLPLDNKKRVDFEEIYKISDENFKYNFNFTPVFLINGYKFPEKYERNDIFYFIDEILEDEEIINEK